MSCGEFYAIIAVSSVLALLLVAIGWLFRYQRIQQRLALGYIDPKEKHNLLAQAAAAAAASSSDGLSPLLGRLGVGSDESIANDRRIRIKNSRSRNSVGRQQWPAGSLASLSHLSSYKHRYRKSNFCENIAEYSVDGITTTTTTTTTDSNQSDNDNDDNTTCNAADNENGNENNEEKGLAARFCPRRRRQEKQKAAARLARNGGVIYDEYDSEYAEGIDEEDDELISRLLLIERKHELLKQPNKLTSFF
jgi:hypothetical protein